MLHRLFDGESCLAPARTALRFGLKHAGVQVVGDVADEDMVQHLAECLSGADMDKRKPFLGKMQRSRRRQSSKPRQLFRCRLPGKGKTGSKIVLPVMSLGILFYLHYNLPIRNPKKNIFIRGRRRLQLLDMPKARVFESTAAPKQKLTENPRAEGSDTLREYLP